ncbi:helix-turn-helix domain-containing protein [Marichromatium bheemlicum]|uniref:helix-turn-helix domain-containing protein n=1 Tax=Marichromatium bheemlicum TaxID=365339 RepID=UPI001FE64D3E|nr:helix-turn-helix transcriptional regulator [Marichromatium bheemlicum]
MHWSKRLRQRRLALGLTQRELATRSGMSQQMISRLESGRAESTGDIVALAQALTVSAEWLLTGAEPARQVEPRPAPATPPSSPPSATATAMPWSSGRPPHVALARIAAAADAGRLSAADLELLNQIADHLARKE